MKRIFIPTRDGSDWQRLLAKPELHWKLGRSAMTAAACWEAADGDLPHDVKAVLASADEPAIARLSLLAALPEWQVQLKGGDRPSSTDILALCRNELGLCVIAVEAKVHEDFGPTVGEKRSSASPGQHERLQYLHSLLRVPRFDDGIRYQLLHRTASALLTAEAFHAATAVMLVQAFGTPEERKKDFSAFASAMRATELKPDVYKVPGLTPAGVYLVWSSGEEKFLAKSLRSVPWDQS